MIYKKIMSSVSDHIQLMKSSELKYDSVFNKREWLYINDTTTQYDQGTSIIETTSLSNNSKFLDYNAGYLSVPILITLTSGSATTAGMANPLDPSTPLPHTPLNLKIHLSFFLLGFLMCLVYQIIQEYVVFSNIIYMFFFIFI